MVTVFALTFLAGAYQKDVLVFIMGAVLVTLLIVPVFLVCNGIVMIRREGHSLANLLSLGLGIIVGLGYPDEDPEARPRDLGKIKFVD